MIDVLVTGGLLSLLWIVLAVQDIRVQKLDNALTSSAFALAVGYRMGRDADYGYVLFLLVDLAIILLLWNLGLFGGGDAKLLLSVLAWQPTVDTWMIVLACLTLAGSAAIAWSRFRRSNIRRHPLGGVIAAAGLIVLWAP